MSDDRPTDPSGWRSPSPEDAWRPTSPTPNGDEGDRGSAAEPEAEDARPEGSSQTAGAEQQPVPPRPPQQRTAGTPPTQPVPPTQVGSGTGTTAWPRPSTSSDPWATPTGSEAREGQQPQTEPGGDVAFGGASSGGSGTPPTGPNGFSIFHQAASPQPPHSDRQRQGRTTPGWLALAAAMIVTAAVSVGATMALVGSSSTSSPVSTSSTVSTAQSVPQVTTSGSTPDWEAVASAVSPATVSITVTGSDSSDIGAGVIYDASGHIVTNYHVISAASSSAVSGASSSSGSIQVTLADGRVYDASVVGSDQTTDLAVIQLKDSPSDLTVARFGSSSDVKVGQDVMAIGSPLGLSDTVTTGVVSALNRPVEVSTTETESQGQSTDPDDPFGQLQGQESQQQSSSSDSVITNAIQVDASINPGNSGGPLFDETGSVIGINSSIASTSTSSSEAGSIGLGFAIPSDLVKSVIDQLISTGTVDHAVLGVTIQAGTATVDGTTRVGAEVASVTSGGSADKAGIKVGDVILAVDGNSVSSAKSLSGYIRRYTGGSQVQIEFARDGKIQTSTVTLQSKSS